MMTTTDNNTNLRKYIGLSACAITAAAASAFIARSYFSSPKAEKNTSQVVRPRSVNYHIARECNYECRFCFHTDLKGDKGVVSLEDGKQAMRLLKAEGMEKINFSGGEPLLQPKWLGEMCRCAKEELDLFVTIVTNGSKLTQSWIDEYGDFIDMVAVSCDSADNETNIHIGRDTKGEHIQIVKRAAHMVKSHPSNIRFKLNTTVTKASVDEDMNNFIEELAPERWKVFQVLPINGENVHGSNGRNCDDLWITDEEYQQFIDRHRKQKALVVEDNDTMRSSYLILDERLRFLNCRDQGKVPSSSILKVGVRKALEESGFYDEEAFVRRQGDFYLQMQKKSAPCELRDVEDIVSDTPNSNGLSGNASPRAE